MVRSEIDQAWQKSGRKVPADQALSTLVRKDLVTRAGKHKDAVYEFKSKGVTFSPESVSTNERVKEFRNTLAK
jgi:hypothetical protein